MNFNLVNKVMDKKALASWMDDNYVSRLKRTDRQEHGCVTCHGETGAGDGPTAPSLKDTQGLYLPPRTWSDCGLCYPHNMGKGIGAARGQAR